MCPFINNPYIYKRIVGESTISNNESMNGHCPRRGCIIKLIMDVIISTVQQASVSVQVRQKSLTIAETPACSATESITAI